MTVERKALWPASMAVQPTSTIRCFDASMVWTGLMRSDNARPGRLGPEPNSRLAVDPGWLRWQGPRTVGTEMMLEAQGQRGRVGNHSTAQHSTTQWSHGNNWVCLVVGKQGRARAAPFGFRTWKLARQDQARPDLSCVTLRSLLADVKQMMGRGCWVLSRTPAYQAIKSTWR